MSRMVDIPVHDIAPLVEVPDYSLYYFVLLCVFGSALSIAVMLWGIKRWRIRRIDERKQALMRLKTIDMSDPKKAAYAICAIGRQFARDNERTEKGYQNLFERLERYKYAPQVEPIDAETLGYLSLYIEMIDA